MEFRVEFSESEVFRKDRGDGLSLERMRTKVSCNKDGQDFVNDLN